MDLKKALSWLSDEIVRYKEKRPISSRKFILMDMITTAQDVTEELRRDVLERVTREVVLDADADIDFSELAVQVLELQLAVEPEDVQPTGEDIVSKVRQCADDTDIFTLVKSAIDSMTTSQMITRWNAVLGEMTDVLSEIAETLERPRKDDQYAKFYDQEVEQFSGTSMYRKECKEFEKWRVDDFATNPTLEEIEDYRMGKLEHLFATGIYNENVGRRQRFKKYPDEIDFELMDDDHTMKKVMYKHYAVMRRMVDFVDGDLVPIPARVGRFFYENRKVKNAKSFRNHFMKYMLKISLAQAERRQLLERQAQEASDAATARLNYFAPQKNLQVMLHEDWFCELATDSSRFNATWTDNFVGALMTSEWRDQIAQEWSVNDKRQMLKCMIIGVLKDAGVLKCSYNFLARQIDPENASTLAKYMGMGKRQPYADWIMEYVKN